ncbi:helix-turn-helix domain-containing protein [Nocardia suismassiliense]|uniref:helix-turn-helix domain-containing protein n=1 Tax=Nocardia suismassiliense TaxID=2077092 RepID=UPI00131F23A5|nr:helix-turn-helix transcriptional regulator [Nocardia suismassiliense]
MNNRIIIEPSTEPLNAALGSMIRDLRKSRRLTQAQAACIAHVSVSAFSKWEEGQRRPLKENLDKFCKALGAEDWLYRKMMSLAQDRVFHAETGLWPPKITDEDIEVIEEFPFPALYRKLPEHDIIYANKACLDVFPMFAPAPLSSPQPANTVVSLLTDGRARATFVDWYAVAHHSVYMLKLLSHGLMTERHSQIVAASDKAHEFDYMWNNDPPPSVFRTNRINVRRLDDPTTVDHYTMRSWCPNYPSGEYELVSTPPVGVKVL